MPAPPLPLPRSPVPLAADPPARLGLVRLWLVVFSAVFAAGALCVLVLIVSLDLRNEIRRGVHDERLQNQELERRVDDDLKRISVPRR